MGARRLGAGTWVPALSMVAMAMILGTCGRENEILAPELAGVGGRASLEERRLSCEVERSARADEEYARYRVNGKACNGDGDCLAAEIALHTQVLEEIRLDYVRCRRGGA